MSQKPKYDLQQVHTLCRRADLDRIWFSAPSRSISTVIRAYSRTDAPKGFVEASQFILAGILTLTTADFVERTLQWGGPEVADVYGLLFDGRPWYVKFILSDGVLEEISFHPPEAPLRTVSGTIIPKGESYE